MPVLLNSATSLLRTLEVETEGSLHKALGKVTTGEYRYWQAAKAVQRILRSRIQKGNHFFTVERSGFVAGSVIGLVPECV